MRHTYESCRESGIREVSRATKSVVEHLESRLHLSSTYVDGSTFAGGPEGLALQDATVAKVASRGGFTYVVGTTTSPGLFAGSLFNGGRTDNSGATDGFVAKYDSDGKLVWGKYFGGEFDDSLTDVAVDDAGGVYVVGTASGYSAQRSYAFGPGALVEAHAGGASDAVVGKLRADGEYEWLSFAGGVGDDTGTGIAVAGGFVFIVGDTTSSEGWVSNDAEQAFGQTWNSVTTAGFVAALATDTGERQWSDYISGFGDDHATAIAADDGNLFITGSTTSHDLGNGAPYDDGARSWSGTAADAYLLHLDPTDGSRMGFTYVNANAAGAATGTAVDMDSSNNPIVVGNTAGSLQWNSTATEGPSGDQNIFVAKFENALTLAYWGVTIGGDAAMDVRDVAVASDDGSVVLGGTTSADTFSAFKVDRFSGVSIVPGNARHGGVDGFVMRLGSDAESVAMKFVGGTGTNTVDGVVVDGAMIIASGTTNSTISEVTLGMPAEGTSAFVMSIGSLDTTPPDVQIQAGNINLMTGDTFTFTVVYDGGSTPISQFPPTLTLVSSGSTLVTDPSTLVTVQGNKTSVEYTITMPVKGWKNPAVYTLTIEPGTVKDAENFNTEATSTTIISDLKAPTAAISSIAYGSRILKVTFDGTGSGVGEIPQSLFLLPSSSGPALTATLASTSSSGNKLTAQYLVGGTSTGKFTVNLGVGAFTDAAGNASVKAVSKSVTLTATSALARRAAVRTLFSMQPLEVKAVDINPLLGNLASVLA